MDSCALGASWFAKPVYFEKGNSSILYLSTSFISLSVSGYATSFGARISWVRVPQERPILAL